MSSNSFSIETIDFSLSIPEGPTTQTSTAVTPTTTTTIGVKLMGSTAPNAPELLKFLANWTFPPLIFSQALTVPSVVLYIAEILVIAWKIVKKNPNFNTPFYKLFIVRAINDSLQWLITSMIFRGSRFGLLKGFFEAMPNFVIGYLVFQNCVSLSAGNLATIFISLNRFTAVYIPLKHERFWKRWLRWSILAVFLIPIPYNVHQVFYFRWFVHDHGSTYTIDNYNRLENNELINAALAATIVCVLSMLISLALNVGTLVLYRRDQERQNQQQNRATFANNEQQQQQQQNPNRWRLSMAAIDQQNRLGRKLLVYAVATFAGHFVGVLNLLLAYITSAGVLADWLVTKVTSDLIFLATINFSALIMDSCSLILPAWLLIWASSEVRQTVFRPFICIFHRLKELQQRGATVVPTGIQMQQIHGDNNVGNIAPA